MSRAGGKRTRAVWPTLPIPSPHLKLRSSAREMAHAHSPSAADTDEPTLPAVAEGRRKAGAALAPAFPAVEGALNPPNAPPKESGAIDPAFDAARGAPKPEEPNPDVLNAGLAPGAAAAVGTFTASERNGADMVSMRLRKRVGSSGTKWMRFRARAARF